jgi:PKD repeat protein
MSGCSNSFGSSEQNCFHTYSESGTYNVTLRVFNGVGYDHIQKTGYITVTDPSNIGSLEVKSSPSHAKIYVNGIDTGKFAKWSFDNLVPGDYQVYVTLDGYTPSAPEKVKVVLGNTSLHFTLKKEKELNTIFFHFQFPLCMALLLFNQLRNALILGQSS